MTKTSALILALFLGGATLAHAAAASMQEGWVAYQSGNYVLAYDIFSRLFKADPADADVNFALGLAAAGKGKLSHAAFAFERVLMIDPEHQRARLELARVYTAMGQYDRAREEFNKVLRAQPPDQVQQNIRKFLSFINKSERPWTVETLLGVTGFYDDNVNYGPSDYLVDTEIGPLEVASNALPIEAWGAALNGMVRGAYDLGARSGWMVNGEVSGYQSWLEEASENDVGFYRLKAGASRYGSKTLLELPLKCDYLELGHDSLLTIFGAEPLLIYAPSTDWQHVTRLYLEHRVYREGDDRDGPFVRGLQTLKRFFGRDRHSLALTGGGFYEDVESPAYDNYGWEVSLAGEYRLFRQSSAYASVEYRAPDYREKLLPDLQEEPRREQQVQAMVGFRTLWDGRWGVDVNYRYINNHSNFGLYNYDRNIFSVSTSLSF